MDGIQVNISVSTCVRGHSALLGKRFVEWPPSLSIPSLSLLCCHTVRSCVSQQCGRVIAHRSVLTLFSAEVNRGATDEKVWRRRARAGLIAIRMEACRQIFSWSQVVQFTRWTGGPGFGSTRHQGSLDRWWCGHGVRSSSASCFFVAFGLPSLSLLAPAGVAVHSTSLATTVQRVRERESWGVGGSPWRAQRHGSAVKPELGSPPISSSGIRTFPLQTVTPVVWRSLRTGFRCSAEPNWPSIPR